MATRVFSYRVLECDGCSARYGEKKADASMAEIRALAYQVGWRFPVKGNRNSDFCPACVSEREGS